jgi:hypothetical protein
MCFSSALIGLLEGERQPWTVKEWETDGIEKWLDQTIGLSKIRNCSLPGFWDQCSSDERVLFLSFLSQVREIENCLLDRFQMISIIQSLPFRQLISWTLNRPQTTLCIESLSLRETILFFPLNHLRRPTLVFSRTTLSNDLWAFDSS